MKVPIYLDNAASTPIDPRVVEKMLPFLQDSDFCGNSTGTHIYAWRAEQAIEAARIEVAELINAQPREIIFTSGASEAINLAIKGTADFYKAKKHIVCVTTEHKAVLETCNYLEQKGYEISYLPVQSNGLIEIDELGKLIRSDTLIVSVMHVNNEIGVVQDIARIGAITKAKGCLFHVDAVQSAGKIPIDVQAMSIDLLSLSSHKIYGPKGVGALFIRRKPRVYLTPLIHGGGQEEGLRSGTLPTHQIVGFGEACAIAAKELPEVSQHLCKLRDKLWQGLAILPCVQRNGCKAAMAPHIINATFIGIDGEELLTQISDIAVSSGSACNAIGATPSHVLKALGLSVDLIRSTLRFSVGRFTTLEEIDHAVAHIQQQMQNF